MLQPLSCQTDHPLAIIDDDDDDNDANGKDNGDDGCPLDSARLWQSASTEQIQDDVQSGMTRVFAKGRRHHPRDGNEHQYHQGESEGGYSDGGAKLSSSTAAAAVVDAEVEAEANAASLQYRLATPRTSEPRIASRFSKSLQTTQTMLF